MDIHLIYHSSAASELGNEEVQKILHTSRTFNRQKDITGCLLFYDRKFLQILEGEEEHVCSLFERIQSDSRHCDIRLEYQQEYDRKLFHNWHMGFATLPNLPMSVIAEHLDVLYMNDSRMSNIENVPLKVFCSISDFMSTQRNEVEQQGTLHDSLSSPNLHTSSTITENILFHQLFNFYAT